MSASSTWLLPRAPSFLSVSRAPVALSLGREPYEHGRKSASTNGSRPPFLASAPPPGPGFRLTRFHASWRTSSLQIRSISAWKRLPGCRLAAAHSRRCSCRTLSIDSRRSGELGPDPPAMPPRLPAPSTRPPQGSFPPVTLFVVAIDGTTTPSDSRCTELDFTFGLYEPPRPDSGRADGPLGFRTPPWTRAAPHTPRRSPSRPGTSETDVAFTVT